MSMPRYVIISSCSTSKGIPAVPGLPGELVLMPCQQRERLNPLHGISSEGYSGKGFVQSGPAEKS